MPVKSTVRTRTWGTRFDQLPSSPPPSPLSLGADIEPSVAAVHAEDNTQDTPMPKKDERPPHDASVFVGSLPPHIEHGELTRMLSEHLVAYADVKSIKVIRDSKGGVCAFVQCEDASSAARLIQTLQAAPPPAFSGRFLRFERARAFRTLLVSYRTPMQFIPAAASEGDAAMPESNEKGKDVELELATAMKIWRPRNAKYRSILYNAEARDFENKNSTVDDKDDANSDIYLCPLLYDEETIHRILLTFGPIEYVRSYDSDSNLSHVSGTVPTPEIDNDDECATQLVNTYPPPHDAPRSPVMDPKCWEVKWEHRDDAVSALMALRRVPHLTVTWAHQPGSFAFDQQSSAAFQSPGSPHPNSTLSSYHLRGQPSSHVPKSTIDGGFQSNSDGRVRTSHVRAASSSSPEPLSHSVSRFREASPVARRALSVQTTGLRSTNDGWKAGQSQAPPKDTSAHPVQKFSGQDIEGQEESQVSAIDTRRLAWTEEDFPPLVDMKGKKPTAVGLWGDRMAFQADEEETDSLTSVNSPSSPVSMTTTPRIDVTPFSPKEDSEPASTGRQGEYQELEVPATPEFGLSPFTPKTSGSTFPHTPSSFGGDVRHSPYKAYGYNNAQEYYGNEGEGECERELDPNTLFVGGLEMYGPYAWDEEKVRNFFAKYGGVEEVKVVRPFNNKSAFAFVKFDNVKAPARAVAEEHNRVHNGRQMRVQLRDCNPPSRGGWKGFGRGRPRYAHHVAPGRSAEPTAQDGHIITLVKQDPNDCLHHDVGLPDDEPTAAAEFSVQDAEEMVQEHTRQESEMSSLPDDAVADEPEKTYGPSVDRPESREHSPEPSNMTLDTTSSFSVNQSQEWFHEAPTSASATPPSSSLGSSASATAPTIHYPMHNVGYYPPPAWMPHFPTQFPYPLHFGYPNYAMPQHAPPAFITPPGTDAIGSTTPNPWGAPSNMYAPFIPYAGYPTRPPTPDQTQAHSPNSNAPLVPTGFIQGDQGTLIPVYHPEALNHYMSTTQHPPPSISQSQPQNPQNTQTWRQYPQPSGFQYVPPQPTTSLPPPELQSNQSQPTHGGPLGWMTNPYRLGFALPQQQLSHVSANYANPTFTRQPAMRGMQFGTRHGQQRDSRDSTPPPRRQNRRGHSVGYVDTHSAPRGLPNRRAGDGAPSEHLYNGGTTSHHKSSAPPQQYGFPGGQGDWSQWVPN